MNKKNTEETFIQKAKETLDKEVGKLDEKVLLRLKHSRYMALERGKGGIFYQPGFLCMAGRGK